MVFFVSLFVTSAGGGREGWPHTTAIHQYWFKSHTPVFLLPSKAAFVFAGALCSKPLKPGEVGVT